jgi:hypothetical protein
MSGLWRFSDTGSPPEVSKVPGQFQERYHRTQASTDSVRVQGRYFPGLYDAEVNLDKTRCNEDIRPLQAV